MERAFVYSLHLLCIAVHLSQVLSSGNVPAFAVDILLNSSDFETADNPVYNLESGDSSTTFSLLFTNDCPNNTFYIQDTGEVKISQPVEFDIEGLEPRCVLTSLGYINSIQTYNCLAVTETLTQSHSVLLLINVIPNLSSTQIIFQEEFYTVEVTEGVESAVLLSGGGIQAITVPISNLLTPTYRILDDHGPFEVSEYTVKCSKYFQLYTTQALDREIQDYYELTIEAYTQQTSANTTIRVIVLDRNDNEPEFQSSPISTTISDDSLQKVTKFLAMDDDSGVNGRVSYSLASLSSSFTVNPYTGSLYRYSSESVSQNTQTIIRASDSGSPQQETLTDFTIFIENVHQQPPLIHDLGSVIASEDDINDHVVTTLYVTHTGPLAVHLDSLDCNCFRLSELRDDAEDEYSVDLLVNTSLDYESFRDGVTITLTAVDQDNMELSTTEQFTVTITDVNEQPMFPQAEYKVTVLEGTPIGSEIFRVEAIDPDYGSYDNLLYTITNAPQNNPFSLNQTSGIIYSTATLDYETIQSIELVITVEDGGGETDQTVLRITILDRNDQRPSFIQSVYTIEVSESVLANESIFHFSASDDDTQCNGGISYSIIFEQPPFFHVDSVSGLLYPLSDDSIDFEMFQQAVVIVRANDLGESSSEFNDATLYISVTGTNDERPEMSKIECPCFMEEATSTTQSCQQLSAYDPDSTSLTFSILSGNELNLFVINTETGIVSTHGILLEYEEGLVYSLDIIASDGDFESNPETLKIIVVDKNNDQPHYEDSISLVESFDAPIGTLLFDLSVQHGDAGYNALTEYVITSDDDAQDVFRLDSLSGRLYLKSSVQQSSEYAFNVRATDILSPTANIATTSVTVEFSEQYNNQPQFTTSVDHIDIASVSTVGVGLYTFNAMDDDSGSNGLLVYSLETSSEFFQVSSDRMLSLNQSLSEEVGSEFILMIVVTDSGSQPKSDHLELHITVYASTIILSGQQYQYNPGVTETHHFAHIPEGTSASVALLQLGQNIGGSAVQYTILDQGDFHNAFFIDGTTVMTQEGFQDVFNRNENEQVFVTILAQYGNNFHYISLTVAIEDINDHGPTFGQDEYTVEIYRSTPQGGFIFEFNDIHDPDVGSNAITNFRLEPTSEIFDIVPDTAFLEVIGTIEESVYTLTVIASDSDDDTLPSDTATLTITVLETVNNAPRILPNTFPVSESISIGDIVGQITVTDDDSGMHGRHTICLASGNLQNHFMIRGDEITIQKQLDFENIDSFTLTIMAYDSSPNPVSSTTQVLINVDDENEKPEFDSDRYFATIVENNPPITTVLTVTASDSELDDIVYSIQNDTTTFTIDPAMGIISTVLPLNREAQSLHTLTVAATDEGGLVSYTNVLIMVLDENDNDPSFISPNFVRVKEDMSLGTQIIKLEASDDDTGANGSVKFEIISGNEANTFSLDAFTGSLTLRKSLDFEMDPNIIEIEFKASDLGVPPRTSESYNIIFSLENVNDNYPIFSSPLYFCTIHEGVDDFTSPCQVNASDEDESDSITYAIENGNIGEAFQIHSQTGTLSRQLAVPIDRETISRYVLKVKASDSGSPSLTSYTIILIEVSDENDNVPIFDPVAATHISDASTRLSQLSFSELLPTNTLLFFAHAVDNDIGENSELSYSIITDDDDLFEVGSNTSAVFLTGNFDFETSQSHSLTIQAANPSGTAIQHTYTINVMNENENIFPPVFSHDTDPAVSISVTASIGVHLVDVNASDADSGPAGDIRYYITGGSGYGYFTIDPLEGEISVLFTLTGIEASDVTLDILATDLGYPPQSSTYTLVVLLEPDCGAKPFFTEAQYTTLAPETFSSDIFTSVQALVNGRPTSDIVYSIETGNEQGRFLMNSTTGVISTAGTLNREDESMYTLFVSASRGTSSINTSYAIVAIEVADSNDNTPFFPIDHDVTIFNNQPIGSNNPFMRVFAIDYDIGKNSELDYSITSDASGNFAIDSTTGDMYLIQSLPESDETLSYPITVRVTDMAILPLSQSTTFTVTVIPPADLANNAAPFFSPSSTVLEISEDAFPGTLVYSAQASDSTNDNLLYRIINPLPNFAITPNSGVIYLIKSLDRENEMQYTIQVEASDGTLASSTFLLNIIVTNVNDNRPYFTVQEIVFMIAENETEVGQLTAVDDDDDDEDVDITYTLVDSKEPSSMDIFSLSEDGVLQVVGTIDREVQPVHFLTVAAVDNGTPSLASYTRVKVIVTDIDDHTQVFIAPLQNISISEATAVGTPFFVVSVFDPDSTAVFDYTLLPDTAPFAINDSTAELYVLTELDAEEQTTYILTITVSDRNSPTKTATTTLEVTVVDELDSTPVLTDPETITIAENMPVYSIVTTVASSENLRPVYYDIVSGNEENHFFIETLTGIIRTAVGLDRESIPSYRLTVQGEFEHDYGTNVSFDVLVGDINDNAPTFSRHFLEYTLPENSSVSNAPMRLDFIDLDQGMNRQISDFHISDPRAASVFNVNTSGYLKIHEPLDREGKFDEIDFEIYLFDLGSPPLYDVAHISITVSDVNDNPPHFSQTSYSFTVSLPVLVDTVLFYIEALDIDIDSIIRYTITSGNGTDKFSINAITGGVSITDNYKLQPYYSLTISARDEGGLEDSVTVSITTKHCGFNNLLFFPREVSMKFAENITIGTQIFSPNILTFDTPANLIYSLSTAESHFLINNSTGEVTLGSSLDREQQSYHYLSVHARDIDDINRIAQADVEIIVTDINDNAPAFDRESYDLYITGNYTGDIIRLRAQDNDEGSNGEVRYSLESGCFGAFDIEENTGQLSLLASLDMFIDASCSMNIRATDNGDPQMTDSTTVTINLVDSNAPLFTSNGVYSAEVNESASRDTVVITVTAEATSPDPHIRYNIDSSQLTTLPFSIDFVSGDVTVNGIGLDYETNTSYILHLEAIDLSTSLEGRATLHIQVLDVNDNRPEFTMAFYQDSVTENSNDGLSVLQVSALDLDSGTNADITFFIDPNDIATTFFTIDDENGQISTSAMIDREQNDLFRFSVLVRDGGYPSLTGTTIVQIEVLDINDNAPSFSEAVYQTTIFETDSQGTSVIFVTATDLDEDSLEYNIVPTPGSSNFDISSGGLITLTTAASTLSDYQYQLNVSAFDGTFYGYTQVLIDLNNENSNPPVFNASIYNAYIIENAMMGAVVIQVFATDDDRGINAELTYSVSSDLFNIGSDTGVITVASQLDREMNPNGVTLIVIARDGGGRTGTAEVDIELGDVNDNPPTFSSLEYAFDVLETVDIGTTVSTTVTATDPDNGVNGTVHYSIETTNTDPAQFPFDIDGQFGVITTILNLDTDVQAVYIFTVSAVDMGTPEMSAETAMVTVQVIVDGQVPPMFENSTYNIDIFENNPSGVLLFTPQLIFTNDTIECDRIQFSLIPDSNVFDIDEDSAMITVTQILDREEMPLHTFTIQADCLPIDFDNLISQFALVTVNVLDVNEEPQFVSGFFIRTSIVENIPVESIVELGGSNAVLANDEDFGTNGDISYSIDSEEEVPFVVHPGSGFISVNGDLDRELRDEYRFDVIASDHGTPPLSDDIRIIVVIEDENDSPPVFDDDIYHGQVSEDASVDTGILTVTASDADTEEFSVNFYSVSGSNAFSIHNTTGNLMVAGELDRETRSTYTLQVTASDGINEATTTVIINVTDINDNVPVFNDTQYGIEVYENSEIGVGFLQVFASDQDIGENAEIRYGILEEQTLVQINESTGVVSFSETPDYEMSQQGHFEFRVTATNPNNVNMVGLSTLVIDLIDLNDNAPQFTGGNGPFPVLENQPGGVLVVRTVADDLDSGINSRVEYTLSEESQQYFTIGLQTGTIHSSVTFDREMNSTYEIFVTATDLGEPPLSSNTTLLVVISDENDNPPLFAHDNYTIHVLEGVSVGEVIENIRADDADEGINAELMYRLTGDNSAHFNLAMQNDGSFNVQVAQMLNHENIAEYNLIITAFDGGFPFLETEVQLTIIVLDENDNPPVFDQSFYPKTFSEDLAVGSEIETVHARDQDSLEITQLTYSIVEPERHTQFEMDTISGTISLVEPLDFETDELHIIIVQADDQLNTPATASVVVTVLNINDNAPLFTVPTYTTSITENEPGRTLFDFTVIDNDKGSNPDIITFAIESGNTNGIFHLSLITGSLTVSQFDYEDYGTSEYLLTITANDNEDPPLTGTAMVTVIAHDVNDNAPKTENQVIHVLLYNGQLELTTLGKLLIRDPDTVNDHVYDILSGDDSVFSIGLNGEIDVIQQPPPVGVYKFTIRVTDGILGSATTFVDIKVANITDAHLANSFARRVNVETAELFLNDHLQQFLIAIETLVDEKTSFVSPRAYVWNITNNHESTIDISVVVESLDGDLIHPNLVQHLIHYNREDFTVVMTSMTSTFSVVTEDVDQCGIESICPLDMFCRVSHEYSSSSTVIGSAAASLVGIDTGEYITCSNETSSCSVLCPEPSYCTQQVGTSVCVDDCTPNPCKNNGKCQNQAPGYYCSCPIGFEGRNCELTTASFQESSYAILPAVSTSTNGTISIEFLAPAGEEGLLYYSSRFNDDQRDFIALEVSAGQVSLFYSYGGNSRRLQAQHNAGRWQTAVVEYTTSHITLIVKTFDPYTISMATFPFPATTSYRSLNLGGPFIVGHLENRFDYNYEGTSFPSLNFCVRELVINGQVQDFSDTLESVNISPSCAGTECGSNTCKNGGECIGDFASFTCVCTVEYAGTTCTENSDSATFSDDSFIQYEILDPFSSSRRRQTQLHQTGRDHISLAFVTSSDTGTIILLGTDNEEDEYLILEVVDGYLQFRFDIGSGPAVARQTTMQVHNDRSHTITLERKDRTVTLVVDDTYVARATSPDGSDTLDIQNDRIFLGANVDADGKPSNGFVGCISGAKLNHRDLPVSGSSKDYNAIPSSGVEDGCTFDPPQSEGAFPTVITFAAGGVGFLIFIILLPISIIICVVGGVAYRRRKKKRQYNPRSPMFNWHPVNRPSTTPTTGDSRQRLVLTQSSQVSASESFALQDLNQNQGSQFVPTTPVISDHPFTTPEQTPEQRRHRAHHQRQTQDTQQQQTPSTNHHARRLQFDQQEREQHQDEENTRPTRKSTNTAIAVEPPSIAKLQNQLSNDSTASPTKEKAATRHTRSPSGHQSIMTTATDKSSVFDDTEVGKYVLKRIETANEGLKSLQKDEMMSFIEEGEFEPLGSIGSLYDILREADEDYSLSQHTYTHTQVEASRPPLKPKPQLSSLPDYPTHTQATVTQNGIHSTKHTKLKKRKEMDAEKEEFPHHSIKKKNLELPDSTKTNGIPPQTVEVSKNRDRRRRNRAAPALGAGESLMERFHNISTSHPHSQEKSNGKLI